MYSLNVNMIIMAVTILVSLLAWRNEQWFNGLLLHPFSVVQSGQWYRMFSYGLVHANWGHLLVNMFTLYFFGRVTEMSYVYLWGGKGHLLYALLYVSALAVSCIQDVRKQADEYSYSAVGASGAVSAVLFASILLWPTQKIFIFFIPIGIPAFIFGILFLAYSVYMAKKGEDNIGHATHFIGAVYGFMFALLFNYKLIFLFLEQIFHR